MTETKATNQDESRPVHILGLGGSTRRASLSRIALTRTLEIAESLGATTQLADIRALDLPIYDADRPQADYPASVHWLLGEAMRADAFIFCSPTYHGTVTGAVKNALDILDYVASGEVPVRPEQTMAGKPVALMACGGGGHNVINALYHSTRALGALVIPTVAIVPNDAIDGDEARIRNERLEHRITSMVEELIDLTRRLRS